MQDKPYLTLELILQNIRVLKVEYYKSLRPFFDTPKTRIIIRRQWKKWVYSLELQSFQKDFIWEYINGYVDIDNNDLTLD